MRNSKTVIMIVMIVAVFVLSVAYAAFSTSLKINGTGSVASTWSVALANASCSATTTKDSGKPSTCTASISGNVLTATVGFASPGDVLTLTFDIVNNGTLNATSSLLAKMYTTAATSTNCGNVTTKGKVKPYTSGGAGTESSLTTITYAGQTIGPTTIISKSASTSYNKASYTFTFTYNSSATGTTPAAGCTFTGTATITQTA